MRFVINALQINFRNYTMSQIKLDHFYFYDNFARSETIFIIFFHFYVQQRSADDGWD